MLRLWTAFQSRLVRDDGASLVEYALLLALIAVVAIAALTTLGNNVEANLDEVASTLGNP